VADEATVRLDDLAARLADCAGRLRNEELDADEAVRLAGECAELASQAAAELDRVARSTPAEEVPGQEGLL
jgi:hypothetical protein